MERRTEQRVVLKLPIQVWGNDENGSPFSQDAIALNVSRGGALINGIETPVRVGDLVGVRYKSSQAHFRVVWSRDTKGEGKIRVAVQNTHSAPCPWEELLPSQETVETAGEECRSTEGKVETLSAGNPCVTCPHRNRRRWQRYNLDVPIQVVLQRHNKTTFVTGRGTAISQGGMAVNAGIEVNIGEEIAVDFTPPYSGSPIRIRGKVRNRNGYQYGIEFLAGSSEQAGEAERLRRILASMSSELHEDPKPVP